MLRDEANHAQALAAVFGRFLGKDVLEKDGGLCEGANPFAVAFHRDVCLFEGVTGTEELYEALRKNGFQSLFISQSEAWEALQRMLRAACWTMAFGMKLEKHVNALCGEDCKVDWCCEILSESGVPCGLRFRSKKALRCHQLRSRSHGHGLQTSIFASVITNSCPWCRSTFATTLIARKHAAAAMLSGHCRVDAGAFPWPISTPLSLQCRLCDDGDNYTSVDEFYDHAVAVHLPKPSPVSLPIVTALHHACDTRGTRRNTSDEGRVHGRGGEETTTDTSEIGGWRTWFGTTERGRRGKRTGVRGRSRGLQKKKPVAFCKNTTQLMGIIIKQCLRTEQDTRSLSLRRLLRHNHHGHGTRRREEHAGADASVQRERTDNWKGAHVGSSSDMGLGRTHCGPPEAGDGSGSGQRGDTDRVPETARRHEHGREVRSRQVLQGRSDVPIRASSHHAVGRQIRGARRSRERTAAPGCSTQVRQSSSDSAVARTATVAGHPSRQVGRDEMVLRAVSAWLGERGITPRSPRWMTMVRSEAVQRMALAEKGNALFPSIPVTPAFSVRQSSSDAVTRGLESFADLFDG